MTLGQKLKERRLELGLTLDQVAKEVGTGKGYLSDLENGNTKNPGFAMIVKVANVLHVPLDELAECVR